MDDKRMTLHDVLEMARQDFRDGLEYIDRTNEDEVTELIWETADTSVPVYTTDLLDVARSDLGLCSVEPGVSRDNRPAAVIAANISDRIQEVLYDEWEAMKADQE